MQRLILIMVFAIVFGEILKAADSFPLGLGNTWRYAQYRVYNDTTIQSDTTINDITILDEYSDNGDIFFTFSGWFHDTYPNQWTVRLDTTTGEIFNNQTNCLWIYPDLNIEDTLFTDCDFPYAHFVAAIDTINFWGMYEEWRNYQHSTYRVQTQHTDYHLLDGIGPIRIEHYDLFFSYSIVSDLIASEIQGYGYGEYLGINEPRALPSTHILLAASPNPFNPTTTISFSIPQPEYTVLRIFDIQGRLIKTLLNGYSLSGEYGIEWDASMVSSGIYVVQLSVGLETFSEKLVLVK